MKKANATTSGMDSLPVVIGKKIYLAPYYPAHHYTQFFSEEQELLETIPVEQKQPTRSMRTIRINTVLYRIRWEPVPPAIAASRISKITHGKQ